jgi:pyruvate/2-oxoglutarate dehydrogenase complex dihydrolipoamide acyltransferase (E2) component
MAKEGAMSAKAEVRLPDLGDIESALIVELLHPVGSQLREGDDLVEVETEKTTFVVPSPTAGVLSDIRIPNGGRVRVGEVLGSIDA